MPPVHSDSEHMVQNSKAKQRSEVLTIVHLVLDARLKAVPIARYKYGEPGLL
jgi:hypothetical protein